MLVPSIRLPAAVFYRPSVSPARAAPRFDAVPFPPNDDVGICRIAERGMGKLRKELLRQSARQGKISARISALTLCLQPNSQRTFITEGWPNGRADIDAPTSFPFGEGLRSFENIRRRLQINS